MNDRSERLVTALKQIAAFAPDTSREDSVISVIVGEIQNCDACTAVKERKWPPTGMCDEHFSKMHRAQRDLEHQLASGKHDMRTIAMQALMDWEITS